ncbi:DUF4417 domain-containing protein [Eubacterium ruminantium]|uniref:DUF4417 domain-containing protein n=1 Tax=Eubacterium ruminantium TaxID=42322 RepID=UPI001568DC9E|nr:DUF4417 domain-containing protein [Eubacterium ruminantium]
MTTQLRGRKKGSFQYDFFGDIYAGDANRVGKYGFPQLAEEDYIPTQQVKPFNYMLSLDEPEKWWIHCFCDDYQFERLWTGFDYYMNYIIRLNGFISTDYSLYRDYDDDKLIWNCYRNRCMAYAVQKNNGIMIPTAGFGPEKTWDWCFDGLPMNSSVAVTTNGTLDDPEARRIFVGGIDALVHTVYPKNLIVCGKYSEWLNNKYPNVNIVGIPSYGQQWQRRCL